MKYIIIIASVLFFFSNDLSAQKAKDKFKIQVDGLGCPFCAYGLEKKFKELKGIKNIKIDVETGNFRFTFPASDSLSIETVENQVDKAGYTPKTTVITRADGRIEKSEAPEKDISDLGELIELKFMVAGNCGMCKSRIEKTSLALDGVARANWDKNTKVFTVEFDPSRSSQQIIQQTIADAGHDTGQYKAGDEVYNKFACLLFV